MELSNMKKQQANYNEELQDNGAHTFV